MKSDLVVILQEILTRRAESGGSPDPEGLRLALKEKGVSDSLIDDALFLFEVMGNITPGSPAVVEPPRPTRVLASEELRGLNPGVVGKLFRLYYLGYLKKEELETVMTDLLFVPMEVQNARARESVSMMLGLTQAQSDFLLDGGFGSVVVH